jgi:hypothetical protein
MPDVSFTALLPTSAPRLEVNWGHWAADLAPLSRGAAGVDCAVETSEQPLLASTPQMKALTALLKQEADLALRSHVKVVIRDEDTKPRSKELQAFSARRPLRAAADPGHAWGISERTDFGPVRWIREFGGLRSPASIGYGAAETG